MYKPKYFDMSEFLCHGFTNGDGCCDGQPEGGMSEKLLKLLDDLREMADQPIKITSGYRCRDHNAIIGGASQSKHIFGEAADIYCSQIDMEKLADMAVKVGFGGVERNRDMDYVHVDVRDDPYYWVHAGGVDYDCDEEGNIL